MCRLRGRGRRHRRRASRRRRPAGDAAVAVAVDEAPVVSGREERRRPASNNRYRSRVRDTRAARWRAHRRRGRHQGERAAGGAGRGPGGVRARTYADEWSASVTAYTTLDGVRWPSGYSFGFGAEGALQWASGTLAEPVATGPYPLVDLDTAIARLRIRTGCGATAVAMCWPSMPKRPRRRRRLTRWHATRRPTTCRRCRRRPTTAQSRRHPNRSWRRCVDVKADLWWVWDADNSVWLLPAYTFTDTEGNVFTVPAVTDEYMIVVEPTIEPQPRRAARPRRRRPADIRPSNVRRRSPW